MILLIAVQQQKLLHCYTFINPICSDSKKHFALSSHADEVEACGSDEEEQRIGAPGGHEGRQHAALTKGLAEHGEGVHDEGTGHAYGHGYIDVGEARDDGGSEQGHDDEGGGVGDLAVPDGAQAVDVGASGSELFYSVTELPEGKLLEVVGLCGEEEVRVLMQVEGQGREGFSAVGFGVEADGVGERPAVFAASDFGSTHDDVDVGVAVFDMEGGEPFALAVGAQGIYGHGPAVFHEPHVV